MQDVKGGVVIRIHNVPAGTSIGFTATVILVDDHKFASIGVAQAKPASADHPITPV